MTRRAAKSLKKSLLHGASAGGRNISGTGKNYYFGGNKMLSKAIFINPGHAPGIDPGACCGEYTEADIVHDIGGIIKGWLEIAGWTVGYLQSDNLGGDSPEYPDIIEAANKFCTGTGGWALSLHLNAAENTSASGTEFLIYGGDEDTVSCDISHYMSNTWNWYQLPIFGEPIFFDRGIKERPDLAFTRLIDYPSVLMELGFISNGLDLDILINNQNRVCFMLLSAVLSVYHDGDLCCCDNAERAAIKRAWTTM